VEVFLFPISSPTFVVVSVLENSHSDWNEVKSQCDFDLHFLYGRDVENFFMYLLAICISSFEKFLFRAFAISSLGH
jgi:hypothetical protein